MKESGELKVAVKAAEAAGKILLGNIGKHRVVLQKDRQDFCTGSDIKSEKAIIEIIRARFPGHSIVSEEAGDLRKKSDFTWYIDPLDGTKQYQRNIPLFSVSVALAEGSDIIAGAVFDPSTKRMYCAEKGKGAFLNGKKIAVSETKELRDAFVYLDSRNVCDLACSKITAAVYRARNFGVGSLGLCYAAQGGYDAFVHPKIAKAVDLAAGALIVREAGGETTDLGGKQFSVESKSCVAGNRILHGKILELLK